MILDELKEKEELRRLKLKQLEAQELELYDYTTTLNDELKKEYKKNPPRRKNDYSGLLLKGEISYGSCRAHIKHTSAYGINITETNNIVIFTNKAIITTAYDGTTMERKIRYPYASMWDHVLYEANRQDFGTFHIKSGPNKIAIDMSPKEFKKLGIIYAFKKDRIYIDYKRLI